ncbi:hypothetical protein PanWU01x14_235440 [Parasponia andersonii]|uniref:Uncharacterized protein n=1 Tax=Parasponia andersonii TaxID=3476 RepID=A0A2P5BIQ3_PARAD|nr:hypothetical protein PanWU01x14_235440 [Parasponia andersonii]
MQLFQLASSKPHNYYSRLTSFVILSSSILIIYFLISLILVHTKILNTYSLSQDVLSPPTSLQHIVFGIASNKNSWPKRKDYIKMWWKPTQMRGCVFLEQGIPTERQQNPKNDSQSLPPICISGDTSRFRYTYRGGYRSAIRVARVVSETVALNHSDVRWYVFGDDDTVFFPENLVKTLSKYDHGLWYYIGTNSEIYEQNAFFGFGMAFGGAGFALSYQLAKVLAKVFDSCIERYPHLYGSDARIYSCMAELGVGLTREPGFHQMDIRGNIFGLLASHPVTPLVSLHHLDHTNPIFPNMSTPQALQHLLKAANVDSQRILQQTICYDRWFSWTIVVSWGYAVQVFGSHVLLPDVLLVPGTFRPWKIRGATILSGLYTFSTKDLHPDTCRRPTVFFLDDVSPGRYGEEIKTTYQKSFVNCSNDAGSPRKLREVRVFSHTLNLDIKQLRAPRRQCCDVLPSSGGEVMDVTIRECKEEELIFMHP